MENAWGGWGRAITDVGGCIAIARLLRNGIDKRRDGDESSHHTILETWLGAPFPDHRQGDPIGREDVERQPFNALTPGLGSSAADEQAAEAEALESVDHKGGEFGRHGGFVLAHPLRVPDERIAVEGHPGRVVPAVDRAQMTQNVGLEMGMQGAEPHEARMLRQALDAPCQEWAIQFA